MPIYEHQCKNCGKITEHITCSVKDGQLQHFNCDVCGGECKRIISKSKFYLKGACWSIDGYSKNPEHDKSVQRCKPHWDQFKKNRGIDP